MVKGGPAPTPSQVPEQWEEETVEEVTRRVRGWRLVDGVPRPRVSSDFIGGCLGVGERRRAEEERVPAGLEAAFEEHARVYGGPQPAGGGARGSAEEERGERAGGSEDGGRGREQRGLQERLYVVTPVAERAGLAPAGVYVGHGTLSRHFREGVDWGNFPKGSAGEFIRANSWEDAISFWRRQAPRTAQFLVRF